MSCILGMIGLGSRPVDPAWRPAGLRAMLPAGGQEGIWRGPGAVLAWRQFQEVPEDRWDRQPQQATGGRFVLAFDGRLDNRAELAARLGLLQSDMDSLPDSRLAMRCLVSAGTDALAWLCGSFALALWDGQERTLLLARDALGMRPLVYQQDGDHFRFASVPRGILADPAVPRDLDGLNLALQVVRRPIPADGTLYKGICSVPPGCFLVLRGDRVAVDFHWRPDRIQPVRLRRPDDYAEGLRAVLETAVAAQTRSIRPVASHLSAGLDSGAVTALAARALAERGGGLLAYTAAPRQGTADTALDSSRILDESALAARTAALYPNIRHVVLRQDGAFDLGILDQVASGADQPARNPVHMPWLEAIARDAARRGAGVLLEGGQGNATVSYDGVGAIASLLLQGRPFASVQAALAFRKTRIPRPRAIGHQVLGILSRRLGLPDGVHRLARRLSPMPDALPGSALRPSWQEAVMRMPVWSWPGLQSMQDGGLRTWAFAKNDMANLRFHHEAVHRLSLRDPTADRRVVEFCWGIPLDRFLLGGRPRGLARAALAGLLPPEVLAESRRGLQAADWLGQLTAAREELAREVDSLAANPRCASLLDIDRLRALVAGLVPGAAPADQVMDLQVALLQGITAGRFLRRFDGSNA